MGVEGKIIDSYDERVRDDQRRLRSLERRNVPQSASDLLGPGYAPTSVSILDWNADETLFNGQFYSPVGAINSPDSSLEWVGISLVENETYAGVQRAWTVRAFSPPLEQTRRWWSIDGGLSRMFTPWKGDTGWIDLPPIAPLTTDLGEEKLQVRISNGTVYFHGLIYTASGLYPVGYTHVVSAAAMPESCIPQFKVNNPITSNVAILARAVAFVDGSIDIVMPATTGDYVDLSGLSYPIALS